MNEQELYSYRFLMKEISNQRQRQEQQTHICIVLGWLAVLSTGRNDGLEMGDGAFLTGPLFWSSYLFKAFLKDQK